MDDAEIKKQLVELAQMIDQYEQADPSSPSLLEMHNRVEKRAGEIFIKLPNPVSEAEFKKYLLENVVALRAKRDEGGKDELKDVSSTGLDEDQREALRRTLEKLDLRLESVELTAEAFRYKTPVGTLREIINHKNISFTDDQYTDRKAYIFACFSELAYLQHSKFDLPTRDRYKVVPSDALSGLQTHEVTVEMPMVMMRTFETETK